MVELSKVGSCELCRSWVEYDLRLYYLKLRMEYTLTANAPYTG